MWPSLCLCHGPFVFPFLSVSVSFGFFPVLFWIVAFFFFLRYGMQKNSSPCHKAKIISSRFLDHDKVTKTSEGCFQHSVELLPQRIEAVSEGKRRQSGTSKV